MADLPHFSGPFRFEYLRSGQQIIPVAEQDTTDEIADCVELTLRTEQTERRTLPSFGRPQMLAFTHDRELAQSVVQQTIVDAEPRVRTLVELAEIDPEDTGLLRLLAMWDLNMESDR
jgi:phage baseplate assembly protein W